jgi:hypothetical protein
MKQRRYRNRMLSTLIGALLFTIICTDTTTIRARKAITGIDKSIVSNRNTAAQNDPSWTEPFPPFRIVGNLYYVGSLGLANYLVATPQGHILINSDLEANVPLIKKSVEQLGFKFSEIKILLISHAHWDHDAGSAMIKRLPAPNTW